MSNTFKVGGIRLDLLLGTADFEKGLSKAERDLLKSAKKMKEGFNTAILGLGVGIGAIGTAAFAAAKSLDAAYDQIRISTGKTGEALEALNQNFRDVFSNVPVSASDAAKAISVLNQRLGVTGEPLKALATQTLNLARVTGSDLGAVLAANTKIIKDWKIGVEGAEKAQDFLFKVSQSTGIAITDLSSKMQSSGSIARALGLSFEETAGLIGKLEQSGAATEVVFAGLKKAVAIFGKEGIDFKTGFGDALELIKSAPNDVEAAGNAIKIFGSKAGPELADAIRSGRLEFKSFLEDIRNSDETINKVAIDTDGIEEQITQIRNKLALPLEKIGIALIDKSKPLLDEFIQWLDQVGKYVDALDPEDIKFFVELAASLSALVLSVKTFNLVTDALDNLKKYVNALIVLAPGIKAFWVALTPWGKIPIAIAAVGTAIYALSGDFENARKVITKEAELINDITSKTLLKGAVGKVPEIKAGDTSALADFTVGLAKLTDNKKYLGITADLHRLSEGFLGVAESAKPAKDGVGGYTGSLDGLIDKANDAKDAVDSLREALAEKNNSIKIDSIEEQLSGISSSSQNEMAESLLGQLQQSTREGILAGYADAIKAGGPEAQELANQIADAEANAVIGKWRGDIAKNIAEAETKAHEDAVQAWETFIEDALNGSFDSKEFGKDLLTGFAANLAASVTGGLTKGVTDAKGIGAYLSQLVLDAVIQGTQTASAYNSVSSSGNGGSSYLDLIGSYFNGGGSSTAAGSSTADFVGPAMSNGSYVANSGAGADFVGPAMSNGQHVANSGSAGASSWAGYAGAAVVVGSAAINASDIDSQNGNNKGTGAAAGAAAGAVIGGVIGSIIPVIGTAAGAAIGAVLGQFVGGALGSTIAWGPTHPESVARKDIVQFFEKMLIERKGLKYFDSDGDAHRLNDIYLGKPNRFNAPGWADTAKEQYGDQTLNAYGGVMTAVGQLLGIKEMVGDQVGYAVADQLGGDIEALKALVDMADLTQEKFNELMLGVGKKGEESWLKVVSQIRDANAAFEEGIVGQGKYAQAAENFFKSQGKGQISLNQLVNMAVEGQEEGLKTIDQLMAALVASGKLSQEEVTALQTAFAENGITTLEQLRNASDMTLAFITAAADASLQNQGSGWREVEEKIDDIKQQVDSLGETFGEKLTLNMEIKTTLDENTKKAMDADLFNAAGADVSTIRETSNGSSGGSTGETAFAKGGIVMGATNFDYLGGVGLMGESGPEAILPLSRSGGKLGVNAWGLGDSGRPVQIIINAPNAAPGMEARILEALSAVEDAAVQRSVDIVSRMI